MAVNTGMILGYDPKSFWVVSLCSFTLGRVTAKDYC